MTISVRKNLVASSKHSLKCPYSMNAKYITFHNTANDAPAANEIAYMNRNGSSTSYHFAVDDKEVVQGFRQTVTLGIAEMVTDRAIVRLSVSKFAIRSQAALSIKRPKNLRLNSSLSF